MANKVVTLLIFTSLFAGCSKGQDDEQETTENRQITKATDPGQLEKEKAVTPISPKKESEKEKNAGEKIKQPQNSKSLPPPKPSLNYEKLIQALNTSDKNAAKKVKEQLKKEGAKIIPTLLKHVDNDSRLVRWYVRQALNEMKELLEPHLPFIVKLIEAKDSGKQTRNFARNLLISLGPKAKSIAPQLVKLLSHQDHKIRHSVNIPLELMGSEAEFVIPQLLENLKDKNHIARHNSYLILRKIGRRSDTWYQFIVNAISKADPKTKDAGFYIPALSDFGDKAAPLLIKLLHHPDPTIQYSASKAFKGLSPSVVTLLIADLKKNLLDRSANQTIKALEHFGPAAAPAIPMLKEFSAAQPLMEPSALSVFSKMGDAGIPPLIDSFKKRNLSFTALRIAGMSKSATLALAKIISSVDSYRVNAVMRAFKQTHRGLDPRVAPYIVNEIKRKDPATCVYAIEALEKLGPVDGSSLSDLSKLFLEDSQQKYPLTRILGNYGEKAVPTFMKGLKSKSSQIRIQSLYGLGYSKTKDSKVFSKVAKALKDKDPKVRAAVRFFLLNQEENLSKSISALLKAYKSGSDQREIIQLFIQLKSAQACSALIACVKVKDEALRLQALEGLLKIGSESEELTKATLKLLKDKSKKVRAKACLILGAHGPKDSKVLSALTKASKDKDREVSRNARRALISMKRR